MNEQLELLKGFEDIGVRFYLGADGLPKMRVPRNITLTPQEIEQLTGIKPAILQAIKQNEVMV